MHFKELLKLLILSFLAFTVRNYNISAFLNINDSATLDEVQLVVGGLIGFLGLSYFVFKGIKWLLTPTAPQEAAVQVPQEAAGQAPQEAAVQAPQEEVAIAEARARAGAIAEVAAIAEAKARAKAEATMEVAIDAAIEAEGNPAAIDMVMRARALAMAAMKAKALAITAAETAAAAAAVVAGATAGVRDFSTTILTCKGFFKDILGMLKIHELNNILEGIKGLGPITGRKALELKEAVYSMDNVNVDKFIKDIEAISIIEDIETVQQLKMQIGGIVSVLWHVGITSWSERILTASICMVLLILLRYGLKDLITINPTLVKILKVGLALFGLTTLVGLSSYTALSCIMGGGGVKESIITIGVVIGGIAMVIESKLLKWFK